ncbi:RNA polymerase sigma factor [Arachidicoccus terrestris]|uniref:RNA polymerase sigma factor n=1 Tax=Arachidicoccus terrestris TaxID=2875539 RepID=UPI001CC41B36|nr:RNA polymerase sigma-70 factor [Arachidicoccus terrestris]UAY55650.1 RNA polymerase sigma-70 factor [Arachidicoccus terrestris]
MEHQTAYDKSLWSAARGGDVSAFSELFELYFPKLYHFAFKYTKDSCLAEDLVQQVFLKCWEKKSALGHVDNIALYLHRCIKNELIDVMRRQVLHLKYQEHMVHNLLREEQSPSAIQLQQIQDEIFTAAVNHLSPQQKRVYKLSKEKGLSYAQIAQEMEVSTHTVKWHAAAAFQSLRVFLKRHEKELFVFSLFFSTFF